MNDLIINHIAELILPRSTDKPLKGKELDELNVVKMVQLSLKMAKLYMLEHIQMTTMRLRRLMLVEGSVPSISRCTYPFNIWWISRT